MRRLTRRHSPGSEHQGGQSSWPSCNPDSKQKPKGGNYHSVFYSCHRGLAIDAISHLLTFFNKTRCIIYIILDRMNSGRHNRVKLHICNEFSPIFLLCDSIIIFQLVSHTK